ncbi:hypothetical protein [Bradyrhizobium liaoningense]
MTDTDNMIRSRDERKTFHTYDPDHGCDPEKDRVVPDQPETFVFANEWDQLVIRQKNWPDDDAWVRIALPFLPAIVERMCVWAGEATTLAVIDRLTALVAERREETLRSLFGERTAPHDEQTNLRPIAAKSARCDPTAAERQRRHRARMRDSARDNRDSQRDTDCDIMADDAPTLRPEAAE